MGVGHVARREVAIRFSTCRICAMKGGIERKQLDFKITGRCFGKVLEGRSRNGIESMGLEMEDLLKK